MVTRARFTADLVSTVNANTSSPANAIFISSGGDVTIANSITVGGNIPGFVQNTYLHATFAQNTTVTTTFADKIQVTNADVTFVTKSTALASNNALINLINDRIQVANADVAYVTKSVALSSNTALVGLINDRLQVANLTSKLSTYWPSANAIAYINANAEGGDMTVNTSIFVASGGETSLEIPVTSNNNLLQVYLNGFALTRSIDWTANSTHVKNIEALAAGDIVQVHEYKVTPANTLNRSSGGGGGGHVFGGTTSGYHSGGTPFSASSNVIEKFPFSSDSNASDVGDLTCGRRQLSSQSSDAAGYTSGGYGTTPPFDVRQNIIDKFPFASDGNATDVGDMTVGRNNTAGQSSDSSGYISGGNGTPYSSNIIEKFPFASDANATDVGDLATVSIAAAGQSSATDGYNSGGKGSSAPVTLNCIQKFSFASDGNATDYADLVFDTAYAAGQSSATHGYLSGGASDTGSPTGNPDNADQRCMIQKFSFSSTSQATDIGELTAKRYQAAGQSSTASGYTSGGRDSSCSNVIDKFPFASDSNATDVGDLTAAVAVGTGNQV
jgi:hypothetical protein